MTVFLVGIIIVIGFVLVTVTLAWRSTSAIHWGLRKIKDEKIDELAAVCANREQSRQYLMDLLGRIHDARHPQGTSPSVRDRWQWAADMAHRVIENKVDILLFLDAAFPPLPPETPYVQKAGDQCAPEATNQMLQKISEGEEEVRKMLASAASTSPRLLTQREIAILRAAMSYAYSNVSDLNDTLRWEGDEDGLHNDGDYIELRDGGSGIPTVHNELKEVEIEALWSVITDTANVNAGCTQPKSHLIYIQQDSSDREKQLSDSDGCEAGV